MKDLLDAIYPRSDKPDYVVRLEPIQTSTKAVFQYITTEEELARYPSRTPRWELAPPHMTASSSYPGVNGATVDSQTILFPTANSSRIASRTSLNSLNLVIESKLPVLFQCQRESGNL